MLIAVVGATGSIGAPVVAALSARGHQVRELSRRAAEYPVDLSTGAGLRGALEGCEVVIDASNAGPQPKPARVVLVEGGRRLLDASRAAGVGHHVCVSIVGIERVPLPYYRVKVEQEQMVEASGVAYSIVRATQFHTLIDSMFRAASRYRLLPGGSAKIQPVAPQEVAQVIAVVAEAEPRGGRETIAGPEVVELGALARSWRAINGARGAVVPAPLPPKLGRALRGGALTDLDPDYRGTISWSTWLSDQA